MRPKRGNWELSSGSEVFFSETQTLHIPFVQTKVFPNTAIGRDRSRELKQDVLPLLRQTSINRTKKAAPARRKGRLD